MALSTDSIRRPDKRRLLTRLAQVIVVGMVSALVVNGYLWHQAAAYNQAIDRAIALDVGWRNTSHHQFTKAYALQQTGNLQGAIKAYSAIATPRDETNAAIKFNMANLYLRRALFVADDDNKDLTIPLIELAKESYRELLHANTNDWDAKYNLERALALLPEGEDEDAGAERNPERSPRASTTVQSQKELP